MSQEFENEIWKPYRCGTYHVSNYGRVMRMKEAVNARVGQIKPICIRPDGYSQFSLHNKPSKPLNVFVHRAVAECFIGEIPEGYEINHKDGIKSNNHVSNLEIVTVSENCKHAIRMGLSIPFKGRKVYRGDEHWTRARPHLLKTRGDKNGSRLHPEKILKGQDTPSAKLTNEEVKHIRWLYNGGGMTVVELAKEFRVTYQNINCIVKNKTWKHLL